MESLSEYFGQVDPLEIDAKLKAIGVSKSRIVEIRQTFWRLDAYDSLISYEPYLDLLVKFLLHDPKKQFTRPDFYRYLIRQIITEKDLISKLRRMALYFENLQSNGLPEDEFDSFLSEHGWTKENLSFTALVEKNLLRIGPDKYDKNNKAEKVQFSHHTLQEYLAFEQILNNDNPVEELKRYITIEDGNEKAIIPSWYNVIRFFVESEPNGNGEFPVAELLCALGKENKDVINESFSDTLTSISPQAANNEIRTEVFDLIYSTYQERLLWIPSWSRDPLSKIITQPQYSKLKEDIVNKRDWIHDKQRYVYQGNAVGLIDAILQYQPELISQNRGFWLDKLVIFANDKNENGVLQRNALSALKNYKTEDEEKNIELINKVTGVFEVEDELIRQAFIDLASELAPNSKNTIDCVVSGISDDSLAIYGRYALYKISNKEGMVHFLEALSEDNNFLFEFLNNESIFNDRGKESDQVLIDKIREFIDGELLDLVKRVVKATFEHSKIYGEERSFFINKLVEIINDKDQSYLKEILNYLVGVPSPKNWHLLDDYTFLLAKIMKEDDLDTLFEIAAKIRTDHGVRIARSIIRIAHYTRGEEGKRIYEKALEQKLLVPIPEEQREVKPWGRRGDKEIIAQFREFLKPEEGKYLPKVFAFYVDNLKLLDELENEKDRLRDLLRNSALNINPRNFKVTIPDKKSNTFTITNLAGWYGDVLRAAQKLLPSEELKNYRQNILDLLPFAYSEDQSTIEELVGKVTDQELEEFVNRVYLDKDKDVRYLIPSFYIYFIQEQTKQENILESAIPVLKSLIDDEVLELRDRQNALQTLGQITPPAEKWKSYYQNLFDTNHDSDIEDQRKIAEIANGLLIKQFNDENAINWRFDELVNRQAPFDEKGQFQVHAVGPLEQELDSLDFARPLIETASLTYLSKLIHLIKYGFELLDRPKEENYRSYALYLCQIVSAVLKKLNNVELRKAYEDIEGLLAEYSDHPDLNWWYYTLIEIKELSLRKYTDRWENQPGGDKKVFDLFYGVKYGDQEILTSELFLSLKDLLSLAGVIRIDGNGKMSLSPPSENILSTKPAAFSPEWQQFYGITVNRIISQYPALSQHIYGAQNREEMIITDKNEVIFGLLINKLFGFVETEKEYHNEHRYVGFRYLLNDRGVNFTKDLQLPQITTIENKYETILEAERDINIAGPGGKIQTVNEKK